jgi:hypothetical protein
MDDFLAITVNGEQRRVPISRRDTPPNHASFNRSGSPGNLFSIVIHKITGQSPCANCLGRIALMNQWGWWKCWRNRKTIATWLAEEARARGHQITETSTLDFLKAAFKEINARHRFQ